MRSSVEGHSEYLTIEERFLARRDGNLLLPIWVVGRDRRYDTALISLPDEADSGARRVWVRGSDLILERGEVPA
jgi:hypothetical protein